MATGAKSARGRPRSVEKERDIRDAAGHLFMEKGFERTSMDEVARRAGVSKQTVYSHFQNKDRLFTACIEAVRDDYFPAEMPPEVASRPFADRLEYFGLAMSRLINSDQAIAMYRALVARAEEGRHMSELFFEIGPEKLQAVMRAEIAAAMASGALRPADADRATSHFTALIKGEMHFKRSLGLLLDVSEATLVAHVRDCVEVFLAAYSPDPSA